MAIVGHRTFNSKKIYFVLITQLIECRKKVSKNNSKKFKKVWQSSKTDISDAETFLMKSC